MANLLAKPARPWALRLLPPFPAVANRVLSLLSKDSADAVQIGAMIKTDPTFTAEILRVANSALFGFRREIATVEHAVTALGLNRVKAMATLTALNGMVKPALKVQCLRRVWLHNLVTALLSEELARASNVGMDTAYTAGILHNLGSLGLMSAYPEEYSRMLEVSSECGFDQISTERDLFEIDHCAAGVYLAEEWNFPDAIIEAIATHHDPPAKGARLSNRLRVAWRLADVLGFAAFPPDKPYSYEELIALIPIIRSSWLSDGPEAAKAEVATRLEGIPK
jgi:putative nucleotidyltransferase with HDIG domain